MGTSEAIKFRVTTLRKQVLKTDDSKKFTKLFIINLYLFKFTKLFMKLS